MRALASDPSLEVVGCHHDRFVLKKSPAARNYLVPSAANREFVRAVHRVVNRERVALVIPTDDEAVRALSNARRAFGERLFLPRKSAIDLCQDKHALAAFLRVRGHPVPATHAVTNLAGLDRVFRRLPRHTLAWCRVRRGSRSLGATAVKSAPQARAWIRYWKEMRGVPVRDFTLSEYLPGRDFLCQSLWRDGTLILIRTYERLAYFGGENTPSGISSLSSLAKTVSEPRVVEIAVRAIRAIDSRASGAFAVDLKENEAGVPAITEINAGRFFNGMTAFEKVSVHNMPVTFVRLALGRKVELRDKCDVPDGYYLVRDLDTLPDVFHSDTLFEGIAEI